MEMTNGWSLQGGRLFNANGNLVAENLEYCDVSVYKNGWYELKTREGWNLYDNKGKLVAKELISGWVFDNGCYALETEDGWELHLANGSLVAKNLKYCYVHDNGSYIVEDEDGVSFYNPNTNLLTKGLEGCYQFKNGWYVITRKDGYRALYRTNGELVADRFIGCWVSDSEYVIIRNSGKQSFKLDGTPISD